jgi:HK97 family phage prohead protease
MTSLERRSVTIGAPAGRTLSGLAIPYGKWSREISEPFNPQFRERITRGAFGDLAGADIKLLFNHNASALLARTRSGTLTLNDTASGLRFTADLAETSVGNDVRAMLERGDLSGEMSFGFYVDRDEWNPRRTERTVTAARLVELSVVVDAAYGNKTSSSLRSVSAAAIEAAALRLEIHKHRMTSHV